MKNSEVLVHISTPATRTNDDLYRTLANAYLAFEPHQPEKSPVNDEPLPETYNVQLNSPSSSQQQALRSDTAAPVTSMDSYGSFPSEFVSGEQSSTQHHSESHDVLSSPDDVSISRLERLDRIQKRWKEQRTPHSSLPKARRHSSSVLFASTKDSSFIEDTQQAFQAMESQLTDHLSTTSEEASGNEADEFVEGELTLDAIETTWSEINRIPFGPSSGNVQVESRLDTSLDLEQPTTRKLLDAVATDEEAQPLLSQDSVTSANPVSERTYRRRHPENTALRVDFNTLPSTVCPPPPKITMISPSTLPSQITPYLEKLKQQNPGRFKPKSRSRAVNADERGHWRVDSRSWPKPVQKQFWTFLQKDVESGRLGWGVTLHRDVVRMRLGLVHLYGWGETIEHMWLALWLHSGGRIWGTGAAWLDGEELEVISIP